MGTAAAMRKFVSIITAIPREPPFKEQLRRSLEDALPGTEGTRHFELRALGQDGESLFDGLISTQRWTPERFLLRIRYQYDGTWPGLEGEIQTDIEDVRDALLTPASWGAVGTYSIVAVLPAMKQTIDFTREDGYYIPELEFTAWIAS